MNELLSAALLGAACIAVWFIALGARAPARIHLRFSSMLFAALAAAGMIAPQTVGEIALLVAALALAILALAAFAAFERPVAPLAAALALALVCLCGLAGAMTGIVALALVPATLAAVLILAVSVRQFDSARLSSVQGMLSATAFLAASSSYALEGAGSAHLLFSAAGLLGLTLALSRSSDVVVENEGGPDLRRVVAVRNLR